jgi:hypothetical protein
MADSRKILLISELKKIIFAKNVKRDALNTTELQKMQIME